MGSKLCENKEKKRYDYVAGLLTGGSGKDQVERFIQLDGFGGNKDHV